MRFRVFKIVTFFLFCLPGSMHSENGQYGPIYQEPGFHADGVFFGVGYESVINHYGGKLILMSKGVALPELAVSSSIFPELIATIVDSGPKSSFLPALSDLDVGPHGDRDSDLCSHLPVIMKSLSEDI